MLTAKRIKSVKLFSVVMASAVTSIAAFAVEPTAERTIKVSGTGTDLLNGALIHSKKPTAAGMIQRGTEIVELSGDLSGKILYHVTTVIDNQKGTLVNTGDQVFSGTIAGSEPVMIHDSRFRFQVNLTSGAESGSVYLFDHIAGPRVSCKLKVAGTGKTADGNPTAVTPAPASLALAGPTPVNRKTIFSRPISGRSRMSQKGHDRLFRGRSRAPLSDPQVQLGDI
jgi:hypothetical protein